MFKTFDEAKNWIENTHRFGEKLDLSRMKIACRLLGHPEESVPMIHIAGTNGKGSTANYLKNILQDSGKKVGIYTSPYVVKFNERIGVNDEYISDEDVLRYSNQLQKLWDHVYEEYLDSITFFELLTLMGFLYFRDQNVDIAIIEVGLGGLLDATNVITPLVSAITNISYDHMKQLGNTLESIALNKLGIVKNGVPLITSIEEESLFPLFQEYTKNQNAPLTIIDFSQATDIHVGEMTSFVYQNEQYQVSLPGYHQVRNAILAIEVIRELQSRYDYVVSLEAIKSGLKRTTWPGRFEIFHHNVILDGAHNMGGITSLKKSLLLMYPDKKIKCLFCMMKDKEHYKVIHELDQFVSEITFTEIEYPRRADAAELYEESNHPNKKIETSLDQALQKLTVLKDDEVLLVTGSLYFISEARKWILSH